MRSAWGAVCSERQWWFGRPAAELKMNGRLAGASLACALHSMEFRLETGNSGGEGAPGWKAAWPAAK